MACTRQDSVRLLDSSLDYLEAHPELEEAVGKALVEVINAKAEQPLQKMSELLLTICRKSTVTTLSTGPGHASENPGLVQLNKRINELVMENEHLTQQAAARATRITILEKHVADLSTTAASVDRLPVLETEVRKLREQGSRMADLERRNLELERLCAQFETTAKQFPAAEGAKHHPTPAYRNMMERLFDEITSLNLNEVGPSQSATLEVAKVCVAPVVTQSTSNDALTRYVSCQTGACHAGRLSGRL